MALRNRTKFHPPSVYFNDRAFERTGMLTISFRNKIISKQKWKHQKNKYVKIKTKEKWKTEKIFVENNEMGKNEK